ncbi:DUF262 domain-containing protein [Vibrio europaeus]|uniref:DUF262 domain-containing protein n=1 Tax=Vibrio europaeus TaxID=300876 RepID=UPI0023428358|nr:DUF262 domain-containing protein [Vibrio europaeus]MDC5842150.1 DUF262 domain-containing protein [Vibrio europaeus]
MQFNDLLSDIEKLVGKRLQSINPSTAPIFLTKIDKKARKYFISNDPDKVGNARFFWELEDVWKDLQFKGFSNVDQALYGSGSSRNQPETVFANLPYIEHFKYKKKKHILLRDEKTHDLGTLKEVEGAEFRSLRKKIDNYFELTNLDLLQEQKDLLVLLTNSLDSVMSKYPGEISIQDTEKALDMLSDLSEKISDATVLNLAEISERTNNGKKIIEEDQNEVALSYDQMLDAPAVTGIDEGSNEGNNEPEQADSQDGKKKKTDSPRIRQLTPVLSLIYDRIQFDDIELQPDFQRKDRIWSVGRKAKLIESILMDLPLPVFYFAVKPDGTWVVVDGLQRITSVYDYMRGEFPLRDLEFLGEDYDDVYFRDLDRTEQRKIREYAITAYLIDMDEDDSTILVELFHRINTYGVKLSPQEIRSAMNQGTSVKFLRYLSATKEFKVSTHNKVKSDRQRDMELCLSAISFILFGYQQFGTKGKESYDNFLSSAMKVLNKMKLNFDDDTSLDKGKSNIIEGTSSEYIELSRRFTQGVDLAYQVFGEATFRKDIDNKSSPISKQLFELIVAYFSALTESQVKFVMENSSDLVDSLYTAIKTDDKDLTDWTSEIYGDANRGFNYSLSTSTGKRVTVLYRFEAFAKILNQTLNMRVEIKPMKEV